MFRNPEAVQWYHAIKAMGWHHDRLCMWMANARMELVEATTLRLAAEARAKQLQDNLDKIEKKKKDEQKKRYNQNRNVKRALDGVTGKYGDEDGTEFIDQSQCSEDLIKWVKAMIECTTGYGREQRKKLLNELFEKAWNGLYAQERLLAMQKAMKLQPRQVVWHMTDKPR
ncbi:hypothetical protein N9O24_00935 [bacterium]|nr:hypothetical protein [bacterium]